jgi:SpoVK/Ycf46/Vps4 family AAA+-type ATPase
MSPNPKTTFERKPVLKLCNNLAEYVRACFTGIWIESHEHQDALIEIAQLCREQQWQLATWDIESGLSIPGQSESDAGSSDPLAAIRAVNALATTDGTAILVLQNFHRFMQSAEIVQALSRQIVTGKQNRTIVIVLSPVVQIPTELEKMFVVLEHDLPGRDQLEEIARGIATEDGELPDGSDLETVLDAAAGLTRMETENAFSLSLVRNERITAETVWELKTQMLKKSGLLSLHRGDDEFNNLGGLTALKAFCKRSLLQPGRTNPNTRPRGVLLLGVPGTGKSAFAKALGKETHRPTLILDIGALMGSLVGQTEQNIRQALKIADAMAPCILFCDEIEKALSGVASSGQADSGVSARMFGTLLSWMNDHTSDVYLIATCNDISKLPPEFSRAERFDGVVFLDLPGGNEKQAIWNLYLDMFEIGRDQRLPDDADWTGAEVKACCRLSALLDVPLVQAAQNVVPVAVTAAESVDRLRTWASGRCLSANQPGIYRHGNSSSKPKSRRRVSRDPSNN